jgi:hypothetical protein
MTELRADRGPALPSGLRVELIERAGSRAQTFADPAGEARTQGYGHRRSRSETSMPSPLNSTTAPGKRSDGSHHVRHWTSVAMTA